MKSINTFVIAVGGKGKRINDDLEKIGFRHSKVFWEIEGKPLISHLIDLAIEAKFKKIFLLKSV